MPYLEDVLLPPPKPKWRRRLWRYGPVVLWISLIFWASTEQFSSDNTAQVIQPWILWLFPKMSPETVEWIHAAIRKSAHVTEYAICALLVARALIGSSWPLLSRGWFVSCVLLLATVSASDEYHQSFVPSRTAAVTDVLIDMSGGLVALTLLALFRRWRRARAAQKQRLWLNQVDGSH
jgi:VanZ family protein